MVVKPGLVRRKHCVAEACAQDLALLSVCHHPLGLFPHLLIQAALKRSEAAHKSRSREPQAQGQAELESALRISTS